jgi:1-acyl-sn-glycerol-3-phosphate acyltransferase
MRFSSGGRLLEQLAGGARAGRSSGPPAHWRTVRTGQDPWTGATSAPDQAWLRSQGGAVAREALQQTLLFPLTRAIARPRVVGADKLLHSPQPALIAANHASDIDTPLILAALPRGWRSRTVVGAAADRFYRNHAYAILTGLWINTFPFDRGGSLRGLASAAEFLRSGHNVLIYPQATRSSSQIEGFRSGVARLAGATSTPIVPVHIGGSAMIMPKGRGLIQRGRATVSFASPVFPIEDEPASDLMDRVQASIAALSRQRPRGHEL